MSCPICESDLVKTDYFNKIFDEYNYYCESCDSYHITYEKDMTEYYANKYHSEFPYANFVSSLLNNFSLATNRTMGRFDNLNKYGKIGKGLNFVEIGGTFGEFYNIAKKKINPKSYTVIEPDSRFNRVKKNLYFENKLLEDIDIQSLKYTDVIQMFHVFEHVFDINDMLEKLKSIKPLKFYFEVPNCTNEKVKIDSLLNHPHYHHFSKKSVELLFLKHGFQGLFLDTIEPMSYHPYKKVSRVNKYKLRFLGENEILDNNGIYLRGIYEI
jgi:hypothetical protein